MERNVELAGIATMVGLLIAATIAARATLHRLRVPPLIGYLVIGFTLRLADDQSAFMTGGHRQVLGFLGELGVIALLFRIGLEANLRDLVRQLRKAWSIWIGNVLMSGFFGFAAGRWILGFDLVPSLVVATAMTATSVAIPSAVWRGSGRLGSREGQLFLDVAEMDDVSGIVLIALLFAILPALKQPGEGSVFLALGAVGLRTVARLAVFGCACYLFAAFVEPRITALCRHLPNPIDPMLMLFSIGITIAGLAEYMGASAAIGAFIAGLAFSRDSDAPRFESSFEPLHDLFAPFFFIALSFAVSPSSLASAGVPAIVLLVTAIIGKVLGTGLPALLRLPAGSALVLSVSMVPRAEIALLIADRGRQLGTWAVPDHVYSAVVVVVATTCITAPLVLMHLLQGSAQADDHVPAP